MYKVEIYRKRMKFLFAMSKIFINFATCFVLKEERIIMKNNN